MGKVIIVQGAERQSWNVGDYIMPVNQEGKPCGVGNPRIFNSPEELYQKFTDYIMFCRGNENIPTVIGFCVFANINPDTFYNYKTYSGYSDTFKMIDAVTEDITLQAMFRAKNPIALIFYLKNRFGYSDKTELTIDNVTDNRTPDQLLMDIESKTEKMKKLLGK